MSVTVDLDRVGSLVAAIGSPQFGSHYRDLFSDFFSFDHCTVFAFRNSAAPDAVVLEAKSERLRALTRELASESERAVLALLPTCEPAASPGAQARPLITPKTMSMAANR